MIKSTTVYTSGLDNRDAIVQVAPGRLAESIAIVNFVAFAKRKKRARRIEMPEHPDNMDWMKGCLTVLTPPVIL